MFNQSILKNDSYILCDTAQYQSGLTCVSTCPSPKYPFNTICTECVFPSTPRSVIFLYGDYNIRPLPLIVQYVEMGSTKVWSSVMMGTISAMMVVRKTAS